MPDSEHAPAVDVASMVKVTGLPEAPPVADRVVPPPKMPVVGGVKVMVWEACTEVTEPLPVVVVAPSAVSASDPPNWSVPTAPITALVTMAGRFAPEAMARAPV